MPKVAVLQRLRAAGLRSPTARIGVQVVKAASTGSIDAEDVYRQMLLRGTPASTGTIYRVLHQFEPAGLVLHEWDRSRTAYYRIKPAPFDVQPLRLVCPDNGRTVVLDDPKLHEELLTAARRYGIDLDGWVLSVQALPRPQASRARDLYPRGRSGARAEPEFLQEGDPMCRIAPDPVALQPATRYCGLLHPPHDHIRRLHRRHRRHLASFSAERR